MEIYRKNEYEYTVNIGFMHYDLTGEWTPKAVAQFIKEMEAEK